MLPKVWTYVSTSFISKTGTSNKICQLKGFLSTYFDIMNLLAGNQNYRLELKWGVSTPGLAGLEFNARGPLGAHCSIGCYDVKAFTIIYLLIIFN